jgi:dGTPase
VTDSIRRRLEKAEDERLAPYALRSRGATRRHPLEDAGRAIDYRTPFQRDRDRIVYSRAFRRLRHKAHGGILPAYEDHRRNRLTHTLEVAQLARTIARALWLNEDLVEAVALGHDLGQPPFGPAGARALDDWMAGRLDGAGGVGLGDLGGFSRAEHSLRVVDRLEVRYAHPGLNLTDAVREGLYKSGPVAAEREPPAGVRPSCAAPFEAQVVGLADRIATAVGDLDDALQSGALPLAHVERLAAVRHLRTKLGPDYGTRGGKFLRSAAIHRGLMHLLATASVLASERALGRFAERHGVRTHEAFLAVRDSAVRGSEILLPKAALALLEDLEAALDVRVRRGASADRVEGRARRVLHGLLAAYHADPTLLDDHVLLRYKEASGTRFLRDVPRVRLDVALERCRGDARFTRILADHVAAMTDPFALAEHARLLEMGAVPIPSAEQLRRERGSRSGAADGDGCPAVEDRLR